MSLIEPVRQDIQHPQQTKKYSAPLRLWHWLNLIVISGSLTTVLINATITDDDTVAKLLKNNFKNAGTVLTDQQTHDAAHELSDSVWGVHIYFGYALVGLLVFRLLLEFFQLADQKFIRKIKSAYQQFNTTKRNRELGRNELVVKSIYAVFYILLIIMAVTGLFLAFEDALAKYKFMRHDVKEVHGFVMYLIIAFIVVHIAGVFLAERKNSAGITSDMINGGKDKQ